MQKFLLSQLNSSKELRLIKYQVEADIVSLLKSSNSIVLIQYIPAVDIALRSALEDAKSSGTLNTHRIESKMNEFAFSLPKSQKISEGGLFSYCCSYLSVTNKSRNFSLVEALIRKDLSVQLVDYCKSEFISCILALNSYLESIHFKVKPYDMLQYEEDMKLISSYANKVKHYVTNPRLLDTSVFNIDSSKCRNYL